MSNDNIDHNARTLLQDVYGDDEDPKPSRLKATISSLKNNPLKKKSQRKVNMVQADNPPKEDNDAKARSIRVHHTESSITYDTTPFPSEGSMFEGKSDRTTNLPCKEDIDEMIFTEILADEIHSRGTFDKEGIPIGDQISIADPAHLTAIQVSVHQ